MIQRIQVQIRNLKIGNGAPVSIQSMTNTKTNDYESTLSQTENLIQAGADLVRISVPDKESIKTIKKVQENVNIPLCADIHFDHSIAIECIEAGIPKIRINPGNIGSNKHFEKVIDAAKSHETVIRIGVNIGSLPIKYHSLSPIDGIVETIREYVTIAEQQNFHNIVLSAKSSDAKETYLANKKLHNEFPYPLHLGVTEAGLYARALAKSYSSLGGLLLEGIGDTIRISIAGDPLREVEAAKELLCALHLRKGPEVIVCPTCSRTNVKDLEYVAKRIEGLLKRYQKNISVAVMGCNVNGPGESKKADLGITFGHENALLFKDSEVIDTIHNTEVYDRIEKEIRNFVS